MLTWQWSRRWTLMPSIKRVSHRGSLLKGVTVYRVLFQSILNAKAVEKKNWNVTQWSKVLFSDESTFCISFGNQLLEVQCEVSTVSDDLGWCWSTVFSEVHNQCSHLPGNSRALYASFCWQALWRRWFDFPAGLGACPYCQRYQKLVQWPWCYCAWLASKLAWPEPHRVSPWDAPVYIYFLWPIVLLDKTLIHRLVLFIVLWSCTETVILTFNCLESIEVHYMEIICRMFSSKTLHFL